MIPKGYQIHIKTWENDFDSLKNTVSSGLTKDDVSYLIELASYFKKKEYPNQISNRGIKAITLFNILKACQEKYPNVNDKIKHDLFVNEKDLDLDLDDFYALMHDYYHRLLCDWILSDAEDENYRYMECFDMFCRVVYEIKVFYLPEEAKDVTSMWSDHL